MGVLRQNYGKTRQNNEFRVWQVKIKKGTIFRQAYNVIFSGLDITRLFISWAGSPTE